MARYPLSLPVQLKQEAEMLATQQGVSLNQFILWAVAEKVGALSNKAALDNRLSICSAKDLIGQVRWLSEWRV